MHVDLDGVWSSIIYHFGPFLMFKIHMIDKITIRLLTMLSELLYKKVIVLTMIMLDNFRNVPLTESYVAAEILVHIVR